MALHGAALTAWKRKHPKLVAQWKKAKRATRKASSSKKRRKAHHHHQEKHVAKKRRKSKSSKRSKRGGGGGGGLLSLSRKETTYAAASAAVYQYIAASASLEPEKYEWFTKTPVIESVGRAATVALIAGVAYKAGVGRKYTKAIAIGVGAVALANLARRRFKLYDSSSGDGKVALSGDDGGGYLAGDVDLANEFHEEAA